MHPRSLFTVLIVAAWLGLVAVGFAVWENYDSTPGASAAPPAPAPPRGEWQLVVFLHPHCPCSAATLDELAQLTADAPPGLGVQIAFVRPAGVPERWERTATWETAAGLKGVRVECDREGADARRAGATTSGYVVLYDPAGSVAFRGGLTRARGRLGEGIGRRAILSALAGQEPEARVAPVFGCSLF